MKSDVEIVGGWIDGFHFFGSGCGLRIAGDSQGQNEEQRCCFHGHRMISSDRRQGKPPLAAAQNFGGTLLDRLCFDRDSVSVLAID
jgi:hypothetical protein